MNAIKADPLNLIFCGVGGQGNVLLARLLGKALVKKGYCVTVSDTFGASQRYGAVMSQMRVSTDKTYGPLMSRGKAHVILGLEPMETLRVLKDYGCPEVVTITNFCPVSPPEVSMGKAKYPAPDELKEAIRSLSRTAWFVEATPIAVSLGTPVVLNIVMAGVLLGANLIPLGADDMRDMIKDNFSSERVPLNLKAFDRGLESFAAL